MVPAALFWLADFTEEGIFHLFVVAVHSITLQFHSFLDLILHAFPHFGDLGVVMFNQSDEAKPGMEVSS